MRIASAFSAGSVPGSPMHTGQTFVFGCSPKAARHPQKTFVRVRSWTWTSRPTAEAYMR